MSETWDPDPSDPSDPTDGMITATPSGIHLSILKDMQRLSILTAEFPECLWVEVSKCKATRLQDAFLVVLST